MPASAAATGGNSPTDALTFNLSGRSIISSYVLIEPIGAGATGTVWRALDRVSGRLVAVKVLREEMLGQPKAVARFVQERAILLMLRHDNIVPVRDLLTVGASLGLVCDLVEGGSLRAYLRERGTLPPAEAASLLCGLAAALAAAHTLGIVHRDVKPDNIMLDRAAAPDRRARLTDFGIARVLDSPGVTTPEVLIGTPSYLAPETINGARPTPAVDIYALGILLYELIVGVRPYAGPTPVAVLRRHLHDRIPPHPGIPEPAWRVIQACTAKDPHRRPTAATLVVTLRSLARSTAAAAALPPPPPAHDDAAAPYAPVDPTAFWPGTPDVPAPVPAARGRRPAWAMAAAAVAVAVAVATPPIWQLLDRPGPGSHVGRQQTPGPRAAGPSGRAPRATPTPAAISAATGAPAAEATGPVRGGVAGSRLAVFGPLRCSGTYEWAVGHPVLVRPCYATGPRVKISGRTQAVPGVQADVSLSLEDADTGELVAGPFSCPGQMFTDVAPEHRCGPFEVSPPRGRRYVVAQSWEYTGRSLVPGGTARGEPFEW